MRTSESDVVLEVRDLHAGYGKTTVLRGVNLTVRRSEFATVLGANGVGKSTLLLTLMGATTVHSGDVLLNGQSVIGMKPSQMVARGVTIVPEGRALVPELSVLENLKLGIAVRGGRSDGASIREDIDEALATFPVLTTRLRQAAGSLSGGEQQMLAIARALAARPSVLILDEPSLGLAPMVVADVFTTLAKAHSGGLTVLVAEQNAKAALTVAEYAHVMRKGEVVLSAPSSEIAGSDILAAEFMGKVNDQ